MFWGTTMTHFPYHNDGHLPTFAPSHQPTMKLHFIVVLLVAVSANNRFTFCGEKPCLVVFQQFSCEEFIQNYVFYGTCCRLIDIPATGGCRVEVGFTPGVAGGQCAWSPRCEPCDPNSEVNDFCNWPHETSTTTYECPVDAYDALAIQKAWGNGTESVADATSDAPSSAFIVEQPPSCPPSAAPVEQPDETSPPVAPSSAPTLFLGGGFMAATTAAAAAALAIVL